MKHSVWVCFVLLVAFGFLPEHWQDHLELVRFLLLTYVEVRGLIWFGAWRDRWIDKRNSRKQNIA
jgi:hypothetical protein